MPLVPVADALVRLGGVASGRDLRGLVGRRRFQRAVAAGEIVRVARRRWATPSVAATASHADRVGGVVSHLSAALSWGWQVKVQPARPSVTVPVDGSSARSDGPA